MQNEKLWGRRPESRTLSQAATVREWESSPNTDELRIGANKLTKLEKAKTTMTTLDVELQEHEVELENPDRLPQNVGRGPCLESRVTYLPVQFRDRADQMDLRGS